MVPSKYAAIKATEPSKQYQLKKQTNITTPSSTYPIFEAPGTDEKEIREDKQSVLQKLLQKGKQRTKKRLQSAPNFEPNPDDPLFFPKIDLGEPTQLLDLEEPIMPTFANGYQTPKNNAVFYSQGRGPVSWIQGPNKSAYLCLNKGEGPDFKLPNNPTKPFPLIFYSKQRR